jgi:hypothetical protein
VGWACIVMVEETNSTVWQGCPGNHLFERPESRWKIECMMNLGKTGWVVDRTAKEPLL